MLTWTCHACGEERPDELIAVFTRVHPIDGDEGATFSENVRYCSDRPDCAARAQQISFLERPGYERPASGARSKATLAERIRHRWFAHAR